MNLLLVPGFMLDADLWTDMRLALDRAATTAEVDTTRDGSIEAMAARAIAEFDAPAFVLGFSMGGYVAREMAYRAPDRIKGLILVATSARGKAPALAALPDGPGFRRLSRSAVARSLHAAHRGDAIVGRVQDMSERLGPDVFARQSQLSREGDLGRLGEIRCPTLIVAAAQDRLRSVDESRELQAGIAGAALEIIDESGHLLPLEQPDRLAGLVLAFCSAHD